MTGGPAAVTGGGKAGGSAERMRRKRERDRAAKAAAAEQLGSEAARQARLPLAPVAEMDPMEEPRPGRPKGSVARATAQWRDLILSRYRSPLVGLAELAARPVGDLARELRCTLLEAMELQRRCLVDLAPYVHSKMPIAIQGEGVQPIVQTLVMTPSLAARMGMAQTIDMPAIAEGDPA